MSVKFSNVVEVLFTDTFFTKYGLTVGNKLFNCKIKVLCCYIHVGHAKLTEILGPEIP